ncbi:AbrB/MazE/SpoVT family DNA-binding domain-containing protein [Levilactobacillus yonginensis]|uniref:AbrB/MazE/SpoVT family DNA-binding domain-containing protein n=1 Tax=Levilactobacillus yonginensis TaxID=1054041 RepID=UPI000F79F10E|nr:AbrB/MazE/SpoVT family DNA-binding domain-containing protein [Levilactobacillus yonginensis]
MNPIKDSKIVKISSKGQVIIPLEFRRELNLAGGTQLVIALNDEGQMILQKLPSSLDWQELIADIPVEQVDIDEDGRYDSKKAPSFDEWMHEE